MVLLTMCGVRASLNVCTDVRISFSSLTWITAPLGPSNDSSTGELSPTLLTSHVPHHQHQHPRSWSDEAGQVLQSDYVINGTLLRNNSLPSPSPISDLGRWFHFERAVSWIQRERTHPSSADSSVDNLRYIASLMYTVAYSVTPLQKKKGGSTDSAKS